MVPINFTRLYRRLFGVLLVMLFSLVSGLPAQAEDGFASPSSFAMAGYNQLVAATTQSSYLFQLPEKLTYDAAADTAADLSGRGYNWEGPPTESQDWRGIKRDTIYFVGLQFAIIVVLYVAPEELSGWSQEAKDSYSLSKWTENVRNPVWDEDEWYVNYILHPYWGATYYIRAQERGFNQWQSFWYSFLLSTLYEFGAEALFEPVSYQDLVVTPVAGALLGEYVFNPIRKWARAKDQLDWADKTLLFATDPLGVVSEELSRLFGLNTRVSFEQLKMEHGTPSSGVWDETEMTSPARARTGPAWGLSVKASW